eukprot:GHVO01050550.1.p1 GENE.GHVO01050550.1~~GHVO01050550.1.p1  ORF type:complete len:146 (+),score=26.15 GHVO01050550.1:394-831(+)
MPHAELDTSSSEHVLGLDFRASMYWDSTFERACIGTRISSKHVLGLEFRATKNHSRIGHRFPSVDTTAVAVSASAFSTPFVFACTCVTSDESMWKNMNFVARMTPALAMRVQRSMGTRQFRRDSGDKALFNNMMAQEKSPNIACN